MLLPTSCNRCHAHKPRFAKQLAASSHWLHVACLQTVKHFTVFVFQVQPPSKPPLKKVRQHRFPDLQNSNFEVLMNFDDLLIIYDYFLLFVLKLLIPSSELWWEWLKSASASFRPRSPLASTRYAAPDLSWS